jgi:hypothetical protein
MIVGWNGDVSPITELALADDALAAAVVKKHLEQTGATSMEIVCADYDVGLRRALARFCEFATLREVEQLAIFNFPKVIGAFLKLNGVQRAPEDGSAQYVIDGRPPHHRRQGQRGHRDTEAAPDAGRSPPWMPVPLFRRDGQL